MGNLIRLIVSLASSIPLLSWHCVSMEEMAASHENGIATSHTLKKSHLLHPINTTPHQREEETPLSTLTGFITLDLTQESLKEKTSENIPLKTVPLGNGKENLIILKSSTLHEWKPQKKTKETINKVLYQKLLEKSTQETGLTKRSKLCLKI
jgi:hypothetical protein